MVRNPIGLNNWNLQSMGPKFPTWQVETPGKRGIGIDVTEPPSKLCAFRVVSGGVTDPI